MDITFYDDNDLLIDDFTFKLKEEIESIKNDLEKEEMNIDLIDFPPVPLPTEE